MPSGTHHPCIATYAYVHWYCSIRKASKYVRNRMVPRLPTARPIAWHSYWKPLPRARGLTLRSRRYSIRAYARVIEGQHNGARRKRSKNGMALLCARRLRRHGTGRLQEERAQCGREVFQSSRQDNECMPPIPPTAPLHVVHSFVCSFQCMEYIRYDSAHVQSADFPSGL